MSEQLDLTRGAGLEAARVKRGWSQNKLHKLSGVSRRQIADAEKGKNLTCDTLKILMRALELKDVTFDGGFTVHLPVQQGRIEVSAVLDASEDIDRLAVEVADRLRQCSASLRHRTATADGEDDAELSEQAAQLVQRFAQQAAKRTPEELTALSDMLMKGLSTKAPAPSTRPVRRRKVK
jgi:transcriptional regulator with XRE-family HTH domain